MAWIHHFIERKEKPPVKKPDTQPVTQIASPMYVPPHMVTSSPSEFTEHFKEIMKQENTANFPGNDFYEFLVVKNNMAGLPEPQAYTIAFSGLAAAGLTKEKLLETAKKYVGIVEREMADFDASFKQMYDEQVTKPQEIIAQRNKEIQELQARIAHLVTECNNLSSESNTNSVKLSQKAESFRMAGNTQKSEIEMEINKINQYIP